MEGPETSTFAELLRSFRVARGFSRRAVARLAGLDSTYVSRLERGVQNPPKVPTVHRLAEALGLAPKDEAALIVASGRLPQGLNIVPRSEGDDAEDIELAVDPHTRPLPIFHDQNRLGDLERSLLERLRTVTDDTRPVSGEDAGEVV